VGITAFAQDGKLKGQILDDDGNPVAYTRVVIYSGDVAKYGSLTDDNGVYSIQGIAPGEYDVEAAFFDSKKRVAGVRVIGGKTVTVDIAFSAPASGSGGGGAGGFTTDEVEIVAYKVPVYEEDQVTTGLVMTGEEVKSMGTRNVQTFASLTPGVYQSDEGSASLSFRGARDNANQYMVDGQKVRGIPNLPQAAIGQFQVITGGVPAEYGDFTGGLVSITTANPSGRFAGSLELVSSELTDPYGRNLAAITVSGPIWKDSVIFNEVDAEGNPIRWGYERPVLGFFLSGEVSYERDQDPASRGIFKLNDGVLDDLEARPLELAEDGLSFRSRANFIRSEDLERLDAKINNVDFRYRLNGRLDFEPIQNLLIKAGGGVERIKSDSWSITNSLFAPAGNTLFTGGSYRGWLRLQQTFQGDSTSALRNLVYSIQGDYSLYQRRFQNNVHMENFFDYGYIGQFMYDREPFYRYVDDPSSSISSAPYWETAAYGTTNLTFDPTNTKNPIWANYNSVIFDHVQNNGITNPNPFSAERTIFNVGDFNNLLFFQGLRNGDSPSSIYSTFTGIGSQAGAYTKFDFEQYRVTGQATAEIKNHNLKVGFEFEQRIERRYDLGARGLWNWMRQWTNFHLNTLSEDISTYEFVTRDGEFQDTVNIPIQYVATDQTNFDRNLRASLGLPIDGTDWINIDQYDPSTFSLDMLNADEMLAEGLGPGLYYGYTYTGEKMSRTDAANFFSDTDNRPMNPFAPTYIAAYIQDKFEFEDIFFNIGVRVDRFDANQKVLKDNFTLYPTFSAAEAAEQLLGGVGNLPSGVGDDWVPYVDDPTNPTAIVGYRNGETWYDANGAPTTSTSIAGASGGTVKPYITEDQVSINSFEDYTPQNVFMPRISFSFPISENSLFFAHYDVLSQRPGQLLSFQGSLLAGRLSDYAFLENTPTISVTNPNLRPEITVDYEAGFKQKVSESMALSISAFYREQRNMIQTRIFNDAYPFTYTTFDNVDFGTVKGFSFSYDMRRGAKLPVQLKASYTLMFSNATGSSFSSGRNVAQFLDGTGLLRFLLPTNTDQRHRITANIDYRYAGSNKGPSIKLGKKTIYPLSNAGANFTMFVGSGTPYSVNTIPTPTGQFGVVTNTQLAGTPNGRRLPWNFRADLKIDKSFFFGGKTKPGAKEKSREYSINAYLEILNLFNTENIMGVYRYTGLADDDGYLQSDIGQQVIATQIDPESFIDLYTVKVNNPNNYSVPRRIRLGLYFNF